MAAGGDYNRSGREIQYRLNQEKTAIEDMSPDEVEVAFKQGMKATEYVHYRDN